MFRVCDAFGMGRMSESIIKLVMREADRTSRKHISQHKKHSVSEKTRSDNPSQNGKE